MNRFGFFFLLFLISYVVKGQVVIEKLPSGQADNTKLQYDGFSYADFGTGEQHSYFSFLYEMSPQLYSELQVFYDTYRTADIIDFSYRVRWYPTRKLYLFSGAGMQLQRPKIGPGLPIVPLRVINGVGYEPQKNISIEAVHELNFNKNSVGRNASSSLVTLKGKYRF